MIEISKSLHKNVNFIVYDICDFETNNKFDFIVACDSIFHLPISMQKIVIKKLCNMLNKDGIPIYTFGDDYGEHDSIWHNESFHYSSIGINENLKAIIESGCECRHLELDQYPQNHVYIIVQKTKDLA